MNKCVVLILTIMVIIVDSNRECLNELEMGNLFEDDSSVNAFKKAYYNLIFLIRYYKELFDSATEGYKEHMLSTPRKWCYDYYRNGLASGTVIEMKSFEALSHSYQRTTEKALSNKKGNVQEYFNYLYDAYKHISDTKLRVFKSPKEFCADIPITVPPLMNSDQDQNQYVGEGSGRQVYVPLDNDGLFIDLNQTYNDENMNEYNYENIDQAQYAGEGSNHYFN